MAPPKFPALAQKSIATVLCPANGRAHVPNAVLSSLPLVGLTDGKSNRLEKACIQNLRACILNWSPLLFRKLLACSCFQLIGFVCLNIFWRARAKGNLISCEIHTRSERHTRSTVELPIKTVVTALAMKNLNMCWEGGGENIFAFPLIGATHTHNTHTYYT